MKCLFIYNPTSGKKKIKKNLEYISNFLTNLYTNLDIYETKAPNDAYDFLLKNAENYDKIIMAGGDGTVNECVSAIAQLPKEIPLGYIPCGTTNDFAKTLRISKNIKKALEIIKKDDIMSYDILNINDKFAVYVCCFGMFTEVSYSASQKLKNIFGKLAYVFRFFRIWFKQKALKLSITHDGKTQEGFYSCLFALNSRSLSGFSMNKNANMNDGKVDIFFIKTKTEKIKFCDKCRLFKVFMQGFDRTKNTDLITKINTSNIKITGLENCSVNLDGEFAFKGDFELKVIKDKIKIITNKK